MLLIVNEAAARIELLSLGRVQEARTLDRQAVIAVVQSLLMAKYKTADMSKIREGLQAEVDAIDRALAAMP